MPPGSPRSWLSGAQTQQLLAPPSTRVCVAAAHWGVSCRHHGSSQEGGQASERGGGGGGRSRQEGGRLVCVCGGGGAAGRRLVRLVGTECFQLGAVVHHHPSIIGVEEYIPYKDFPRSGTTTKARPGTKQGKNIEAELIKTCMFPPVPRAQPPVGG